MATGVWFRRCLRLHDNPALLEACKDDEVVPFFVLDPAFKCGVNRLNFLLESLADLDRQLRSCGSRLVVLRGETVATLRKIIDGKGPFRVAALHWEQAPEPHLHARDERVRKMAAGRGVEVRTFPGHTLLDTVALTSDPKFKAPTANTSVTKLVNSTDISRPLKAPSRIPGGRVKGNFPVPGIGEFFKEKPSAPMRGGETEGLRRLRRECADAKKICAFDKTKTSSTTGHIGDRVSTTGISPYLAHGCLSARMVFHRVRDAIKGKKHTKEPVSLLGQLHFREMFYLLGRATPNFDRQSGNPHCLPVNWSKDKKLQRAWAEGRTGYPLIDAIMRQLKETGFIHHLARHAVSCFLTRGDLWQSWTVGRDVFDKLLLDADWSLNNGNWQGLAGVATWSRPYYYIYDPVKPAGGALNVEKTGAYVRRFVPELRKFPAEFIYAPWTAPRAVQEKAGAVVGRDYPRPVVEHSSARDANLKKFKAAMAARRSKRGSASPQEKRPARVSSAAAGSKRRAPSGHPPPARKRPRQWFSIA